MPKPSDRHQFEEDRRRRSDYGTFKITPTDRKALPFVAEQRFVRYDTLGEWLAPSYERAIFEKRLPEVKGSARGYVIFSLVKFPNLQPPIMEGAI